MKVNIKKISELTGFSAATISNALNYKKGVNAETAAIIRKTASELGYFDDSKISKIKCVVIKKDGYIVEDTPFFPAMIGGMEQECKNNGIEMVLVNLDMRETGFREELKLLQNDQSAGIILIGTEMTDEDMYIIEGIRAPFLVIDYWKEDMSFDSVLICNSDSARTAVEYLIGKGHTEIGYLRGKQRIKPFRGRYYGYSIGLQKAGLPVNREYQVSLSANMEGAYYDMKMYLAERHRLPTAFFADNDIIALGAMRAMRECGISVPEDVSIIGFDDVTFSAVSTPPLTTLKVPKQEEGRVAVRRLLDICNDTSAVKLKIEICTQFIERESVRDIRR